MVSGVAPGTLALTSNVGKSTLGRSLTGSCRYPMMPNRRIASMTRVVMTGRRIKPSAMFIRTSCVLQISCARLRPPVETRRAASHSRTETPLLLPLAWCLRWRNHPRRCLLDLHFGARNQPQLSIGNDAFAHRQTLLHNHLPCLLRFTSGNRPSLHGIVVFDHIHERPLLSVLDCLGRNYQSIALRLQCQISIHKLPWP